MSSTGSTYSFRPYQHRRQVVTERNSKRKEKKNSVRIFPSSLALSVNDRFTNQILMYLTGNIAQVPTAHGQTKINRTILTCRDRFCRLGLTNVSIGGIASLKEKSSMRLAKGLK